MEGVYDGFVSRHLNRRVSRPIARALTHTPLTPNQVSIFSLGVAVGSFFSFVYGYHIAGALLAQASSIIDGVDGDLARAKKMTSAFGGFLDAILDRYADAVILLGLTIWAAKSAGEGLDVYVWTTGFLALAGTFVVTYTRARIDHVPRNFFDRGITSVASRDVRLLIVMVGALTGQGFITLIILAILANLVVLLRLIYARRALKDA
ncbi:MAG: CDP-alcohol phosphatidyltransferase family protein [Chloroflexi bacterium]|nr:CDP-alcohol phosphatidyltransferase family protein [Chloroflexota bacterium]MCH8869265.1 CDP-alcohol phosphatidyltransferase family protein [Chloroflexota bacterium]MCI0796833.1 CDP-alcohol phosphatidyltransferase family protein [Chloroflexota bacterium]MCI0869651.1 CDP-alcohol phosphatidyltransferase family protein [Chloroflexota bacterium]